MSVATVLRMLKEMEEQGVLLGKLEYYDVIPLVSARHIYHQKHKDNR